MTSVLTAVEPTEGVENMINIKKSTKQVKKIDRREEATASRSRFQPGSLIVTAISLKTEV